MIELKEEHFIGKGKNRVCYQHPVHKDICIKITQKNHKRKYDENEKEYKYFTKHLKNKDADLPISAPSNWVETNKGKGLCYKLILDFDGNISKSLEYVLKNNQFSMKEAIEEMKKLKQVFCEHMISPTEVNPENILLQKLSEKKHRLVLVDGLGTSNIIPAFYISKKLGQNQIARRFDRRIQKMEEQTLLEPVTA